MTNTNPYTANWAGAMAPDWTAGQATYEPLLALADQIGAACSEAGEQLSSAYAEAYQKLVLQAGGMPGKLPDPQQAQMFNAMMDPSSLAERLDETKESAMAMGDEAAEMGIQIGLACLNAFEQATLALAKFQEQVGATSQIDVVRSATATGAELIRKVTRAGASTLREMAGCRPEANRGHQPASDGKRSRREPPASEAHTEPATTPASPPRNEPPLGGIELAR